MTYLEAVQKVVQTVGTCLPEAIFSECVKETMREPASKPTLDALDRLAKLGAKRVTLPRRVLDRLLMELGPVRSIPGTWEMIEPKSHSNAVGVYRGIALIEEDPYV